MPRKAKRKSRRVGRGFGDFLGSSLAGIGGGIGQGVHDLFGNLFGGKRVRRRRRGAGVGDVLAKLNKVAKESQVISKALNEFEAPQFAQTIASSLGYGRKTTKKRMKGGMVLMPRAYNVPIVGMGALGGSMGNLHL